MHPAKTNPANTEEDPLGDLVDELEIKVKSVSFEDNLQVPNRN